MTIMKSFMCFCEEPKETTGLEVCYRELRPWRMQRNVQYEKLFSTKKQNSRSVNLFDCEYASWTGIKYFETSIGTPSAWVSLTDKRPPQHSRRMQSKCKNVGHSKFWHSTSYLVSSESLYRVLFFINPYRQHWTTTFHKNWRTRAYHPQHYFEIHAQTIVIIVF
jgi:hypothetical protein